MNLVERINALKKEKEAIILVHNYQRKEIYEVADFIGDSLALSKEAAKTKAKIIVFCGVDFMAESAKILNPNKKVLIPTRVAKCPMAAMINSEQLREFKQKHKAPVVCYINTTADVKAYSDVCCTSMNAVDIVNSLSKDKIIFVPDQNLGKYVQSKSNKKLILWPGYCYVHANISAEKIKEAKLLHPRAKVIAHPECRPEVLKLADHICGTGGMIKYVKESKAKEFIIATEEGMCNRLEREVKGKIFYRAGGVCFNMKEITLERVYNSLKYEQYEIKLSQEIIKAAYKALARMLL